MNVSSILFAATLAFLVPVDRGVSAPLSTYLPDGPYREATPKPSDVLGIEIGDWHVRHDQLVNYLQSLAASSDRVEVEVIGHTYEQRPLLLLTISSSDNLGKKEELRSQHLAWALSTEDTINSSEELPLIVNMGYGVHGDESSASNAALIVAYYLAASESDDVKQLLDRSIILLDPCLNPDGFARFGQWANMHRGKHPIADKASREHHAAWPGGRTNHYWFDLNRDWLLVQHPESKARVEHFHRWLPNIVTDFHEMGSDSTYFFQPGVPKRTNPLTPEKNQKLTRLIAAHHAASFDEAGMLYFNQEKYDDFYYGKGSTYPDAHGAVGILFEQASSRGHLQESPNGEFDFAFTIRNQVRTSLSTFAAARAMRTEMLDYQREFFSFATKFAEADPVQGYVFGSAENPSATWHMADIIRRHGIEFYELSKALPNRPYRPGSSYWVPAQQPQYRLVKTLFETRTEFRDSIFYDISAWTLPLATGVAYEELSEAPPDAIGARVKELPFPAGSVSSKKQSYAYAFEFTDYYAGKLLHALLDTEVRCKVAMRPFEAITHSGSTSFDRGTIVIPSGIQDKVPEERLSAILEQHVGGTGCKVYAIETGNTPVGIDLGSSQMLSLEKPRPLLLAGDGVSAYEAGEIWHLLDQRFDVPVALIEPKELRELNLEPYTHLLLAGGNYSTIGADEIVNIRGWIDRGGVLVAMKSAAEWVAQKKLGSFHFSSEEAKENIDSTASSKSDVPTAAVKTIQRLPYGNFADDRDSRRTSGAIFRGLADLTHPLCFGLKFDEIALFRNSNLILQVSTDPYATPVIYQPSSRVAGYVHSDMAKRIDHSAAVVVEKQGKGTVIAFAQNPNFRAFWFGTNRLFLNALFFGASIEKTRDLSKGGPSEEVESDAHSH